MQPAENIEASKRNQERVAENETRQKPPEPGRFWWVVNDTKDGMHYLEKHIPQELLRRWQRVLKQHSWNLVSHVSLKCWRSKWKNFQVSIKKPVNIWHLQCSRLLLICFFKQALLSMTSKAACSPLSESWEIIFLFPWKWTGAPLPDEQSQQHSSQQKQKYKGLKGAASPWRRAPLPWSEHRLQSAY